MRRLLLLAVLLAPAALADDDDAVGHSFGSHWFAGGGTVEVTAPVNGDAYLAGEYLAVRAPVSGTAYAFGAHVEVTGPVAKGLVVGAGAVRVDGTVHHHARLFGETIELTPSARLDGPVSIAGGAVTVSGELAGDVKVAARDARIDAKIAGDLDVTAQRIELGPNARIGGHLRYRGDRAPDVAAGAEIAGGIEQRPGRYEHFHWGDGHRYFHGFGSGVGFGTSFVIGIVMLLLGPAFMSDTSALARREAVQSLGIGLMVLAAVPIACLLLVLTIIGIPVALLGLALYAALLMLGYACGAVALGDLALQSLAPKRAASTGARVVALLGALIALVLVRHVYLIGPLLVFLVLLGGIGALLQRALRKVPPASAA